MNRAIRRTTACICGAALLLSGCYTAHRSDLATGNGPTGPSTTATPIGTAPQDTKRLPRTIEGTNVVVPPEPVPAGHWDFFARQADGAPVGYPPCDEIHYVIHLGKGPANGQSLIQQALTRVTDVSGLRFKFDGFTDDGPKAFDQVRDGPVWIGWAGRDESDVWATEPAAVGLGGSSYRQSLRGTTGYLSGQVVLDPGTPQEPRFGPGATWGKVILHELGHLVGLAHVADDQELMHPSETAAYPSDYGPGDLRGLWELGTSRGCGGDALIASDGAWTNGRSR